MGWGTILYLAALTTIDTSLYEVAAIDGANRWRQTWHVTRLELDQDVDVTVRAKVGAQN